MRKIATWIFLVMILLVPLALAQEGGGGDDPVPVPDVDWKIYLALVFNSGLVALIVQLLKKYALPWLKASYPFLIPLIGMGLGILSGWVLSEFGIDISPIGDLFGAGVASGALASAGFAVVKEVDNKVKGKLAA